MNEASGWIEIVSHALFNRRVAVLNVPRVMLRGVRDNQPFASREMRSMQKMTGTRISFLLGSHSALIHESLHQLPWCNSEIVDTAGLFSQLKGSSTFGSDKFDSRINFGLESNESKAF